MTLAPLILVPGLGSDGAVWRLVIERLGGVAACVVAETRLDDAIAAIAVPTLIAVGELDVLTPPALAEELRDGIPGATLHVLDGSGHLPPIEQPDAVAALLREWLR